MTSLLDLPSDVLAEVAAFLAPADLLNLVIAAPRRLQAAPPSFPGSIVDTVATESLAALNLEAG